jgi:hypothetical protein
MTREDRRRRLRNRAAEVRVRPPQPTEAFEVLGMTVYVAAADLARLRGD